MTAPLPVVQQRASKTRKIRRIIFGLVGVLLTVWVLVVSVNIVAVSQGSVDESSDAVVSLAPQYERLATAESLYEHDLAEVLAISYLPQDVAPYANDQSVVASVHEHCADEQLQSVVCFTPQPVTTFGEAKTVQEVAQGRHWDSLTVVTSHYHAFRTRYIFEKCLGNEIDINVVYADVDMGPERWAWHVVYENAAFVKALIQTNLNC